MKFALLGTDPDSVRLAAAAVAAGHSISWLGDVRPEDKSALAKLLPGNADDSGAWELVLDAGTADAVIMGQGSAGNELRAEQLKRITAEAIPILVVHPACDSVLPYYEVDMTRREMNGLVRHYNPVGGHAVFAELAQWVLEGNSSAGAIHQVTCERRMADTSRGKMLEKLARDVEPLATVAGDIRRVSAIGPKMDQESFASLQVQMTCSGPASVRWSVCSATGADGDMVMSLVGEHGTIRLFAFDDAAPSDPRPWELEFATRAQQARRMLDEFDPAASAIRQFAAAVTTEDGERRIAMSTWNTATRAMEVVDAIQLSLEKGRTLDVHQQELTERLAFRGTMAAMGCGLLMVGFLVFVGVSLFGAAEGKNRPQLIDAWPVVLLAVLAFFLLLQCAPLLVTKKRAAAAKAAEVRTTDDAAG